MKGHILIFSTIASIAICQEDSKDLYQTASKFCQEIGIKYLTFVSQTDDVNLLDFSKTIRSRRLSSSQFDPISEDLNIFVVRQDTKLSDFLNLIFMTKPLKSILLFLAEFDESLIVNLLKDLKSDSSFYLIHKPNQIQHILTIKGNAKVVINEVTRDSQGHLVNPSNLQGLHLTCDTMAYPPDLWLSDCDQSGKNCHSYGKTF